MNYKPIPKAKGTTPESVQKIFDEPSNAQGRLVMYNPFTGEASCIELPNDDLQIYFEVYANAINDLPEKIKERFPEVVDEIRPILTNQYLVDPRPGPFAAWFQQNKIGAFFNFDINLDHDQKKVRSITINIDTEEFERLIDPQILVKDLGEYCAWRREITLSQLDITPKAITTMPPKPPVLSLITAARKNVYIALKPFVDEGQHSDLLSILSQKEISGKIYVRVQQVALANFFRQVYDARHCTNPKSDIAKWIGYWFRVLGEGGSAQDPTYDTLYDALTRSDKNPKTSMIEYKP